MGGRKQPFRIVTGKNKPIAFAGVFITKAERQKPLFSIITAPANDFMSKIHSRMPVILPSHAESKWLERGLTQVATHRMLRSFEGRMSAAAAPLSVNNPKNENLPIF